MPEMTPLEGRRQRAREAFYDESCAHLRDSECVSGIESAIETATRVQITPEAVDAFRARANNCWCRWCLPAALSAFANVLGFEVEGVQE